MACGAATMPVYLAFPFCLFDFVLLFSVYGFFLLVLFFFIVIG